MTFDVQRMSQRHSGGTKDYHLVAITNRENRRCLLIQRWAKAGQWGNGIKTTQYDSVRELEREWAAVSRKKFRSCEYDSAIPTKNVSGLSVDELKKNLGAYWPKLGQHAEWLIPGVGMGDVVPDEPAEWDDGEKRFVKPGKKNKATLAEAEDEEVSVEDRVKENPQWGSW